MRVSRAEKLGAKKPRSGRNDGFTLVEVIIAGSLMIILCVGTLTVFSYVVKINRGENIRLQALSVLQRKVEFYRSLRFSPYETSTALNATAETNVGALTSEDGRQFNIMVSIDDNPSTAAIDTDANSKFKQISITAVPANAASTWISNLRTTVTIQRVRTN